MYYFHVDSIDECGNYDDFIFSCNLNFHIIRFVTNTCTCFRKHIENNVKTDLVKWWCERVILVFVSREIDTEQKLEPMSVQSATMIYTCFRSRHNKLIYNDTTKLICSMISTHQHMSHSLYWRSSDDLTINCPIYYGPQYASAWRAVYKMLHSVSIHGYINGRVSE